MNTYAPVVIGARYGRLVVTAGPHVRIVGKSRQRKQHYDCVCDCGTERSVSSAHLKTGWATSCGCKSKENGKAKFFKHGETETRLHHIWCNIKGRCFSPTNEAYYNYGGRGISMCEEWRNNFTAFRDWANANGHADHLSIDRINNDGNYEPSNCRWATRLEQARNKRTNVKVSGFGDTRCISEWATDQRCIVDMRLLWSRLSRGWSLEKAMTTPAKKLDQSWRNKAR